MKACVNLCFAVAAGMTLLLPAAARAQHTYTGTWTLNAAASDLGGIQPPKSDVVTMVQRGKSFRWSEVIVMPKGTVLKEAWSGALDGVARPVAGAKGSMASYKANGTGRWTSPEGNSDLFARVSADGKQFLLTSTSTMPDGKTMKQTFVYDRMK